MPRIKAPQRLGRRRVLLCATALGGMRLAWVGGAWALEQPVQLYAAMTVRPALDAVLAAYRAAGGSVTAVYAPTPVLVRQLAGGAPADILLTADADWMNRAVDQGLIDRASRVDLLTTDLVLAAERGVAPSGTLTPAYDLGELLGGGRIAMCDPDQHPAGRVGKEALQSLGLWAEAAPYLAIAESAPGAVTLIDRGEAKAAVVFRSDLHGDDKSVIVGMFPAASHAPIVYPVALTRTHSAHAAKALAFLKSPQAMAIFATFGYRAIAG